MRLALCLNVFPLAAHSNPRSTSSDQDHLVQQEYAILQHLRWILRCTLLKSLYSPLFPSQIRILLRPLFHFAGFCRQSQDHAQRRKAQGVEFQIAKMCKQVRLGAAPHFAPRMHRFLHRLFWRLSLRLQRVSLFPCAESNHRFQLLLEHANLYVSNNGELLLRDYDPATMRLDARDNHQPNRFHKTLADSERVEAKVFAPHAQ